MDFSRFKEWLHHLFNPHCEECNLNKQEKLECKTCIELRRQLEITNHNNQELINSLIKHLNPVEEVRENFEKVELPKRIPWHLRKQMLEQSSKERALAMNDIGKPDIDNSIKKLEDEILGFKEVNS